MQRPSGMRRLVVGLLGGALLLAVVAVAGRGLDTFTLHWLLLGAALGGFIMGGVVAE